MKQEVSLVRLRDGEVIETMEWTNRPRGNEGKGICKTFCKRLREFFNAVRDPRYGWLSYLEERRVGELRTMESYVPKVKVKQYNF